jgi:hypothetical protein
MTPFSHTYQYESDKKKNLIPDMDDV